MIKLDKLLPHDRSTLSECVVGGTVYGSDMVLIKNRDRNYNPILHIVRQLTPYGVELCYARDKYTDWCEGMNEFGIGIVNTALFVKRDEKDYDKAKKKKARSKDGRRIREALGKDNIEDALKSVLTYHGGIKGHTLIADGNRAYLVENTSRVKPIVKKKNLHKEPVIRTNHGIEHPEAGYSDGPDATSSELRMVNATTVIHQTTEWKQLAINFKKHHQDMGPKFDIVRDQTKLWTSSQLVMNLAEIHMILYLIPGKVRYTGIDNLIKKPDYKPKIKVNAVQYK